jgi:hypothetical protein
MMAEDEDADRLPYDTKKKVEWESVQIHTAKVSKTKIVGFRSLGCMANGREKLIVEFTGKF